MVQRLAKYAGATRHRFILFSITVWTFIAQYKVNHVFDIKQNYVFQLDPRIHSGWESNSIHRNPTTCEKRSQGNIKSYFHKISIYVVGIIKTILRRLLNLFFHFYRYQFFLQLKQDLLQQRLECPYETSVQLAAYSVQCK